MRTTALILALLGVATTAAAQSTAEVQRAALVPRPPNDGYAYQADGRRDPFMSLINGGVEPATTLKKDGLRTFMLAEISVRGVMQTKDALVAMVQGPDNRTYVIHKGDKLADAVVKTTKLVGRPPHARPPVTAKMMVARAPMMAWPVAMRRVCSRRVGDGVARTRARIRSRRSAMALSLEGLNRRT